jgi:hypothetical protein
MIAPAARVGAVLAAAAPRTRTIAVAAGAENSSALARRFATGPAGTSTKSLAALHCQPLPKGYSTSTSARIADFGAKKLAAPPPPLQPPSPGASAGRTATNAPASSSSAARGQARARAAPPAAVAETAPSAASAGSAAEAPPSVVPFSFRTIPGWWRANRDRFKYFVRSYGYLTVAAYLGVYVVTLFSIFGLVRAGVIRGPDVNSWLNNWRVKKAITDKPVALSPVATDFGVAWLLTKTTEPLRLVATIALMPVLVRRLPPVLARIFRVPPKPASSG